VEKFLKRQSLKEIVSLIHKALLAATQITRWNKFDLIYNIFTFTVE
jgi:hypothetical protein